MKTQLQIKEVLSCILFFILVLIVQTGWAVEYPSKVLTLVHPAGPGGSSDITFRAVTSVAADYLGQPIVMKMMPGGGGAIGSEFVARSAPDGYTLLCAGPSWNTNPPAIEGRSKGPNDLLGVCRVNYSAGMIIVRSDSPFRTFKELLAWARANPETLVYGNTGIWGGADILWKKIKLKTGIITRDIPHDGGGQNLLALLGGQVQVAGLLGTQSFPQIKAGKLRVLAVCDHKRDPDLPAVPTAIEEGVEAVDINWRGIAVPKGTPRPIIEKLGSAVKKMTENESVIAMIKKLGDDIQFLGPDEFNKFWTDEYEGLKSLAKEFKK